jgi:hypothetical protein
MSKLCIPHPAGSSSEAFLDWMKQLEKEFPLWLIGKQGTLKTRKGSIHFHINSRLPKETGTLELTWDPKMPGMIEVKLNDNRRGTWAGEARNELLRGMEK